MISMAHILKDSDPESIDVKTMFDYELCTFPPALFESKNVMIAPTLPQLAKNCLKSKLPQSTTWMVISLFMAGADTLCKLGTEDLVYKKYEMFAQFITNNLSCPGLYYLICNRGQQPIKF